MAIKVRYNNKQMENKFVHNNLLVKKTKTGK